MEMGETGSQSWNVKSSRRDNIKVVKSFAYRGIGAKLLDILARSRFYGGVQKFVPSLDGATQNEVIK